MVIVRDEKYLVSARIPIGQFFSLPDDDVFVELREPETKTTMRLQRASQTNDIEKVVDAFVEAFPGILVDHSLMKSETEKMEAAEVINTLAKKLELFMYVFTEYSNKVLFTLGKKSAGK